MLILAPTALATTDTVTTTSGSASTPGSLPYEVANASPGDTITFGASLDGQTITLSSPVDIEGDLTIQGPGAGELAISGGGSSQILTICAASCDGEVNVSVTGLTLTDGASAGSGGAISDGAGSGQLTLSSDAFTDDTVLSESGTTYGGAVATGGSDALTIDHSSFTGDTAGGGSGADNEGGATGMGGAINDQGTGAFTITASSFTNDTAGGGESNGAYSGSDSGEGGAIKYLGQGTSATSSSTLTVSSSTFTDDAAGSASSAANGGEGAGGAIATYASESSFSHSTFTSDAAGGANGTSTQSGEGWGGAIAAYSSLSIMGSTFNLDTAGGSGTNNCGSGSGFGGAVVADSGSLSVSDSTFNADSAGGSAGGETASGAGYGGAVAAASIPNPCTPFYTVFNPPLGSPSSAMLAGDTIDGNAASTAGSGIYGASVVDVEATIVSGNTGSDDCDANVASSSYSLEYGVGSTADSCGFSQMQVSQAGPLLGSLQNNGSTTETQALPADSPAVNVVPRGKADCPTSGESTDQRGEPRPGNGESSCDVGAYEYQVPPVPSSVSKPTSTHNPATAGQLTTFSVTVSPVPASGTVEFTADGAAVSGCTQVTVSAATGQALCAKSFAAPGSYRIEAAYSGDSSENASNSTPLVQVVSTVPTSTRVSTQLQEAVTGQPVSYTATISPASSGTVEFLQNGKPIADCTSLALHGAQTVCRTAYGRPGLYSITAVYGSTGANAGSKSQALTETINSSARLVGRPTAHDHRIRFMIACANGSGGCRVIASGRTKAGKSVGKHSWTVRAGMRKRLVLTISLRRADGNKVVLQLAEKSLGITTKVAERTVSFK